MERGNAVEIESKKIHPFFSAPKITLKDTPTNAITPVTPDPSCSPNSVDDDADSNPPANKRKRKRRQNDDTHETFTSAPTSVSVATPSCTSSAPAVKSKLLKLNRATGTIGSPPKTQPAVKTTKRRGRKPKPLLARIRYGQDSDATRLQIGQVIDQILVGTHTMASKDTSDALSGTPPSSRDADERPVDKPNTQKESSQVKEVPEKSQSAVKTTQAKVPKASVLPQKPTHPFFQGKPKPGAVVEEKEKSSTGTSLPKRQVLFSSTPNSSKHPRSGTPKYNIPAPGTNNNGILRVPGAQHPAWPSKETAHVRGHSPPPKTPSEANAQSDHLPSSRKSKGQQVQINESESLLHQAVLNLNLKQLREELKASDDNEFHPPPPILRIPSRHFESGKKLQARIHGELRTLRGNDVSKTHPAITHAYNSIEKSLSAFDRSTCESTSWAQKHAPSSARRVLQSGREAELLRDWLENLKVMAVDTGATDGGGKPKTVAPPKGRGKRKKKLDEFVVSSDDELGEFSELSDGEADWFPSGSQGNTKKTVVKTGSRRKSGGGGRFANAVVLSGPHGCGKSATVYAIAKELDFEVFEINSGARRNGKDILEKVGDMTRNHLVQHHQKEDTSKEEAAVPEDEVDRDLKSGRQGMMTAFFKPNSATAPKPAKTPVGTSNPKETKRPAKAQKQSLILLEEVDVLYEEDKQFWATVISMILQSKRPFVMTCNDEALVPLQNLNLHGIFRFSTPPKDLAVDMLLLIAANEGHALRRRAVETLYDSRGHDLRASITELNYWCQIGVGDVQGGFNWFYPRWPKGSDVDEEGNTIRVVSQDTYQAGLGWLSRDSAIEDSACRSAREELHQQCYENWSLDIHNSCPNDDFSSWVPTATKPRSSVKERLSLLEFADSYISSISDADVGSAGFSATPNQISLDASIPNLPTKTREDFIVGRQLLEVSPSIQYDTLYLDISTTLKDLARTQLRDGPVNQATHFPKPLKEADVAATLETHFLDSLRADPAITRTDYSVAFDPIAASEKAMTAGYLDPSVFDATMRTISLDVAPYVRSIVSYDQRLQQERRSRSSLLSEGGQPGKKRMRTTRSAYSALEGGSRASTRRERYFSVHVNPHLVMRTGGKGWDKVAASATTTGVDGQHITDASSVGSSPREHGEENGGSPN